MSQALPIRADVEKRLAKIVEQMVKHEATPQISDEEKKHIRSGIKSFNHKISIDSLVIAGVDGTGDFPSLSYADSFIYLTMASGTCYQADKVDGLKEIDSIDAILELTWLTNDPAQFGPAYDESFSNLASEDVKDVIAKSDYSLIKQHYSGKNDTNEQLFEGLIRPQPSDTGNVAIQLRSSAELGAALRLIKSDACPNYVLLDSTFSLPFASRNYVSLFFEHLKRLCCVEALKRQIGFFALSKSHGMPGMMLIEELAIEATDCQESVAEHWYFRLPMESKDEWVLEILENRKVPPPGAVSYLVRFHRNTPVMRLDMDFEYWSSVIQSNDADELVHNERQVFEALDYAGHDQRAYGYPYPIKAGHDRASMTNADRLAFKKMIIHEAEKKGMDPRIFRNASQETGHG